MSNELFTPITLWEDFSIEHAPIVEELGEFVRGDISVKRFYLKGRDVSDGEVRIYCAIARNIKKNKLPGVLVLQDVKDAADETFITHLAEKGYAAMTFDYAGDSGINGNHSVYPESLSGINYGKCFKSLNSLSGSAKQSAWYEWGITARYALDFLKQQVFVNKTGIIGISEGATIAWHVAATDKGLSSATFILNAGWKAYSGYNKFETGNIPEFSSDVVNYLACIEPQSYAGHVKCPSLLMVATNSMKYDFDRAYDTFSRLDPMLYSSIDYSIGARDTIHTENVKTMDLFLSKFLKGSSKERLPEPTEIDGEMIDGILTVKVSPDPDGLLSCSLYVSENTMNSSIRGYKEITEFKKDEDGNFEFNYTPYVNSEQVMFFARSVYKSGYSVCSNVLCKKFTSGENLIKYKSNVIYSSREDYAEDVFIPARENHVKPTGITLLEDNNVRTLKGPMGISGTCCYGGLLSFFVGTKKYQPKDDAIIMMDVYAKEDSKLKVSLITGYTEDKKKYTTTVKVTGANAWHNVKLTRMEFKTEEGMGLKSFSNVNAIEIDAEGEHLINNLLWV